MISKRKNINIPFDLENRILHGLASEWENALWVLDDRCRDLMKKPLFRLNDMRHHFAHWSGEKREICMSRHLVYHHSWGVVRAVLLHEMAHQLAESILQVDHEPPHGSTFRQACRLLRANPKASAEYRMLDEKPLEGDQNPNDKILIRVQKLMALAESRNRHEAQAAMQKAHDLIKKYNLDLLHMRRKRRFISIFIGKPALRHFREEYHMAQLIQDYYFVEGVWVSAYVIEKGKMGRVLEISGTRHNIEMAGYVHSFVDRFIASQWHHYNRKKRHNRYRRSDFTIGLLEGFRAKLEQKSFRNNPRTDEHSLVKIDDPQLKAYMNYQYPRTTIFRRSATDRDARIYEDGRKVGRQLVIYKGISVKGSETAALIEHK